MNEIFISYRRDDAAGYVDRLYADLVRKYGEKAVFMDQDIELGGDFPEVIREAVENARIALVVIAHRWLEVRDADGNRRLDDPEDWVAEEVRLALEHVPNVVPLLIDGARLPQPDELPAALRSLPNKQTFDVSRKRWEFDLKQLSRQMDRWLRSARSRPRALRAASLPALAALLLMLAVWGTGLLTRVPGYLSARDKLDEWASSGADSSFRSGRVALIVDREAEVGEDGSLEERRLRRRDHARLIDGLSNAGARVIAFDYFSTSPPMSPTTPPTRSSGRR